MNAKEVLYWIMKTDNKPTQIKHKKRFKLLNYVDS